jgi:tetratricopeptide (TPR) repeat protein
VADHQTQPERLRKARTVAERLRESDEPPFLDTLGWIHYRLGEHEQAIPLLEQASAERADSPAYHYHLGMAYLGAGREADARKALEKAVADESADYRGIDEARAALAQLEE